MDPTQQVRLGTTDLHVTRLGLGTAPLGGMYAPVGDAAATATVDRSWELGLRFYDTAPLYGYGLSERRLGGTLASRPRDEYVLASKVGRLLVPVGEAAGGAQEFWTEQTGVEPVFDYSYGATMRGVEESLRRLGLDRIDVLHIHDPDDHFEQAVSGAYRALAELRSQGVIGAVGAGMNQAAMLARFAREGDFDCFLLAGRQTLLDHSGLDELLPLCAEKRISVIAGGVYNSGLLADPRPGAHYDYLPASADLLKRAIAIGRVCARHGVPLKAAAIQFPFGHPAVASVVIGARSPEEIEENVKMLTHPIPDDLWSELKADNLLAEEVPTP